jgi:hypothetical protein
MDPKGKGMVINDKEKETFYEPKDDKPTDLGSSHKKRNGKKKRRIKKIIYYDSDASSSSPRDETMKTLRRKRKWLIKTILLVILASPITRMPIYYLFHLENHHTLMERIIHFGVIKCVVIYFPSILVRCEHEGLSLSPKDRFVITPYLYSYQVQPLQTVWAAA